MIKVQAKVRRTDGGDTVVVMIGPVDPLRVPAFPLLSAVNFYVIDRIFSIVTASCYRQDAGLLLCVSNSQA